MGSEIGPAGIFVDPLDRVAAFLGQGRLQPGWLLRVDHALELHLPFTGQLRHLSSQYYSCHTYIYRVPVAELFRGRCITLGQQHSNSCAVREKGPLGGSDCYLLSNKS